MNKSIKKILVTGASLLMLASAGAGISNINANASSGYYYVKHHYSYKDAVPNVPIGTRLHGKPVTSSEDSKLVDFEYGPAYGFIPWRDVGYHRNVRHVHHHYYRPAKRYGTLRPRRAKAHKVRNHRSHRKSVRRVKRSHKRHKSVKRVNRVAAAKRAFIRYAKSTRKTMRIPNFSKTSWKQIREWNHLAD